MGQGQPREIILGSTYIHNATYQVSRSSVNWFWRRWFFKVFTIYGHGGQFGHVTRTFWTTFRSLDPWRLHMKFGYNWPWASSFRGEVVWNCWRTTTDGGACLYYKLPRSLRLRLAKNVTVCNKCPQRPSPLTTCNNPDTGKSNLSHSQDMLFYKFASVVFK